MQKGTAHQSKKEREREREKAWGEKIQVTRSKKIWVTHKKDPLPAARMV